MKNSICCFAAICALLIMFSFHCFAADGAVTYGKWVWDTGSYTMANGEQTEFYATHGSVDITTIGSDQFGQEWLFVGNPPTGYIVRSWSVVGGVYTESGWNFVPNKAQQANSFYDVNQKNIRFNTGLASNRIILTISLFDIALTIFDAQLYNVGTKQYENAKYQNSSFDITSFKPGKYQILAKTEKGIFVQNYVIETK